MPTVGSNSKPAYVYDAGTDTWIPIGPGEHTHDYSASAHNHDSTYIAKTLTTTTGDIIYASSANTPARLGIGSAGQVLGISSGIPAWTTPSGSGLVKIGTYTFSGVTTYDIPNVFSSTYDNYLLVGDERSTAGGGLSLQMLVAGSPHTQFYSYGKFAVDYGGNTFSEGATNATKWQVANSNSGGERGFFAINLWYPYQAVATHYWSQHTTNAGASKRQGFFAGQHDMLTSYTGLRLSNTSASNIAGSMTIYGYSL